MLLFMKSNISGRKISIIKILIIGFSDVNAYIIGENENKYLIFVLTENNRKVLEICKTL